MADEEDKGEELSIEIVGEELEDGLRITVFEHDEVVGTVTAKLLEQLGVWHGGFIVFGEDPIEPGLSFNEVGIDDGARLSLSPQSVFEGGRRYAEAQPTRHRNPTQGRSVLEQEDRGHVLLEPRVQGARILAA
jgi:hypothetical protein